MKTTKIEWCHFTFSPWYICTEVSPGCVNCYAKMLSKGRMRRLTGGRWGKGVPRVRAKGIWSTARAMDRKAAEGCTRFRVFPSLCDWLDEEVPIQWLADFLKLIHETPNLDWLLLTKRPENAEERVNAALKLFNPGIDMWTLGGTMPHNVWIGVSVEDQKRADERIPQLLKIPAIVRFLSCEPLLGPVDISMYLATGWTEPPYDDIVNWVIIGGESGPKARTCQVEWIDNLTEQCHKAGVPAFVKQLGSNALTHNANMFDWPDDVKLVGLGKGFAAARIHFKHPKGGNMAEWPVDFRVRQIPNTLPMIS